MTDRASAPFLVIVSRTGDANATALAHQLGGVVLTPLHLSMPGMVVAMPPRDEDVVVTSGGRLRTGDVAAVICLLPAVTAWDVPDIARPDQNYAAREMTAAMYYVLLGFGDRVYNHPSPRALTGEVSCADERKACELIGIKPGADASAGRRVSVTIVDGEIAALESGCAPVVVRRFWIDRKFRSSLADWARKNALRLLNVDLSLARDGSWQWLGAHGRPKFDQDDAVAALRRSLHVPQSRLR